MDTEKIAQELKNFLKCHVPLVVLDETYHIVIRKCVLTLLTSEQLSVGDIRLLQLDAVDLVKGLSPDQWSTLFQKYMTLKACISKAVEYEKTHQAATGHEHGS